MSPNVLEENYNFCNLFEKYINYEFFLNGELHVRGYKFSCEYMFNNFLKRYELEDICAKFKYYFKLLNDTEWDSNQCTTGRSAPVSTDFNTNVEYLNFWLNNKLKSGEFSDISVNDFYNKIKPQRNSSRGKCDLSNKIHNIEEDQLKNMKTLYYLYDKYNQIISIRNNNIEQCKSYSNECLQKYQEAVKNCSNDNNSKYCTALSVFKTKYEELSNGYIYSSCNKDSLKKLISDKVTLEVKTFGDSEPNMLISGGFTDSLKPGKTVSVGNKKNNNVIIISILGATICIFCIFLFTYKFYPMSSKFYLNVKRKKLMLFNEKDNEIYEKELNYYEGNNRDSQRIPGKIGYYSVIYN
ncbi:variable surface protein [Plasmodium gonderi]|uniref:Variable surface protein n=1 Tax=Plasmodium gonderi TaxID=77519 RepID=A0A1Y1JAA5_PLAGO|nr:variable surface protein [Plasmodium gonderi]GAW79200.1 variable surface protein [Plasmodium gonderi]